MSFDVDKYIHETTSPEFWRTKFQEILGDRSSVSFLIFDNLTIQAKRYLNFRLALNHTAPVYINDFNRRGSLSYWGYGLHPYEGANNWLFERTNNPRDYVGGPPVRYPMQKSQHWRIYDKYLSPISSIIEVSFNLDFPYPKNEFEFLDLIDNHFQNARMVVNDLFLSGVCLVRSTLLPRELQLQLKDWTENPEEVYVKMISNVDQKMRTSFTQHSMVSPDQTMSLVVNPILFSDSRLIARNDTERSSEWSEIDEFEDTLTEPAHRPAMARL